jgi:hypothetical protein
MKTTDERILTGIKQVTQIEHFNQITTCFISQKHALPPSSSLAGTRFAQGLPEIVGHHASQFIGNDESCNKHS